jgi:hypothetical protein
VEGMGGGEQDRMKRVKLSLFSKEELRKECGVGGQDRRKRVKLSLL